MPARTPEIQMKIVATEKLSRAYLQKLNLQNYLNTTLAALIITVSLFWLLFHIGGKSIVTFYGDAMYAVAAFIGSSWAYTTAYRARYGPLRLEARHQLAWLLIGTGLFAYGAGGSYYTYLEYIGQLNPVPSLSDIGFTLFYLFTFTGLLLMPTIPKPERVRIRLALDAFITTLCVLGISWYFIIWPIYQALKNNPKFIPILITVISYPLWDIMLILAIVLLILQRTERVLHFSLFLCVLGVLSQIWADTSYALTIPFNTYSTGTFYIDTFWFIGVLLIGLSGPYQYAKIARKIFSERAHSPQITNSLDYTALNYNEKNQRRLLFLQSALIYFPLAFLLTLTVYNEVTQDASILSFFLVLLTVIVGILVTVRYLLATQENEMLLRQRERRRAEAEHLRLLTSQLTEILDLDPLQKRIVTLATSELGFDAAALLLFEEFDQPLDKQSSLLIHTATSTSLETTSLRLPGANVSSCSVLLGKELEVTWAEHTLHLPAEVQTWLQNQGIVATLFVPLIYQGKVLGSLSFSRRTVNHFSQHDRYIAHAFTEQAAAALEHSYLYEMAREQELFSKALANIATRLNSIVSEPFDIHELICTEGANALQADYALLYIPNDNGQLIPLAIFTSDQVPPLQPGDWPNIRRHDFEVQAFTALQPTLVVFDQLTSSGSLPAITEKIPALGDPPLRSGSSGALPAYSKLNRLRERETSSLRGALIQRFVHTVILAPLIARNDPVGLLVLARSQRPGASKKKSFVLADLSQAQDFAEQAAIAFTNAHLYQQIRIAHQRLQELDQLKDQFMVTASHELRTPLTAVQGYLELLAQYGEVLPPNQRREFLQKAQRGCDELVLLLHNVMDASRLEIEAGIRASHLEQVHVSEIIKGVIDLIEPQLTQEQREVRLHIPNLLYVRADPARLRQVLLNISVNALKYSPPGTPIMFSARSVFDSVPAVIISVIDKGKGIKPQDQAILFQRFVRIESDMNSTVRGSGLGLYISRRLIEAMGGKIWIESTGVPGTGSTFHIQLPLA